MDDSLARVLRPDGWALLKALPPYDEDRALALGQQLRDRGMPADLVAAAMTQSRLRAKAKAKFGEFADGMLFTPEGLEQATRLSVAALHAERFRRAGLGHVVDLTCGLGADAMALAGLGVRVTAIEKDEATAAAATVNLRYFPEARVIHADCLDLDLADVGAKGLFADPARRSGGQRVFNPAAYTPPLDALLDLRHRWPIGIKAAPGRPHTAIPPDAEAQWISIGTGTASGEVIECGLWFGPLRAVESAGAGPAKTALVIRAGQGIIVTPTVDTRVGVGRLGRYVYEPDGAVIRAGLVSEVAARVGGRLVSEQIAYVTSDAAAPCPFAAGFEVLESMPFSLKALKAALRRRGVGTVTIKKRGTAVVPEELRAKLALKGDEAATVILTPLEGKQSALIVEPLP